MLNIAKYCVRYLWDHSWSPIHSPTFTVEFFSLFHLILITNLTASMAQFINRSRASSCEDTCCRKSTLYRRWVALTSPSPGGLMLVSKAVLSEGTDPAGDAASPFPCFAPKRLVAQSSSSCSLCQQNNFGWLVFSAGLLDEVITFLHHEGHETA